MKKLLKKYWPLIIICLLGLALRVYQLGEFPVGITWDEPALGYNAYSILKTGRDEYGQFLPLIFKSFGDDKPGFFVYYLIPSVAIFGLNTFAIRFPSALAGTVMIGAVFFLVKLIFAEKKELFLLPYLSALILAISPWAIHFSRGAWEVNLALLTILLGMIFFLKVIQKQAVKDLWLAFFLFAIAFNVYHGAKVFLIVLLSGSLLIFWPQLKRFPKKKKILGIILLIVLLFPLLLSFQGSARRARVTNVFSYTRSPEEAEEIFSQEEFLPRISYPIFHSEPISKAWWIGSRYFNHFTARFLFFEGDWQSPRHSAPYMGMMYYLEIPFLIFGLAFAIIKVKAKEKYFLFWWLLSGPVPSAITRDEVQGLRSFWMVIPLVIFTALGINVFYRWLKNKKKFFYWGGVLFLIVGYLICLIFYLDLYYIHMPVRDSWGWNYGTQEIAQIVEENKEKYERIIVTQNYGQPYVFYLFYTQYPPEDYQPQAYLKENPWGDVGFVEKVDEIEFRDIYWPDDRKCRHCLFIGDEFELPKDDILTTPGARIVKEIQFLDGRLAYRIVVTD